MKDGHRDKLRQLPRERKMYLLQQNQHIKDNKPTEPTRKSLPTSTSTTSIFTPKGLRPKAIKRSETTRLLFASKRNSSSNTLSTTSNHSLNSLSSEDTVDIIPRSGSSRSNRLSISEVRPSQKKNQKKETLHTYDRSLPASASSSSYSIQKHRQIVSPSPSVQKIPESLSSTSLSNQSNVSIKNNNGKEPVTPIPTTSTATLATTSTTATTNTASTSLSSQLTTDAASEVADLPEVTISPSPEVAEAVTNEPQSSSTTVPASSSTAPPIDRRAATYKYARRNLRSSQNQSKVGSMILEFDALAHKHGDPKTDESAAWLLLDNKTLPRQTGGGSSGGASHTNVNHIFPKQSDSASTVSSSVTNSYAYQSLTRKEGSNLASMAVSEEVNISGRDRNSPYYYVERLRSR
jgi:hypothetical protein